MIKQTSLTDCLNDPQRAAVASQLVHTLVLAGAGSGKTRVLVHRIAWLMAECQVGAQQILAVTFTNKAALEMRERIEALQGHQLYGMWIGTFHGLAHRLLRLHYAAAQLPQEFQILDSGDQHRLLRRILKQRGLDEASWPPKQVQWYVNKQKESGLRAAQVVTEGDPFNTTMQSIYADYEKICQQSGVVDFSELLLRSLELLQANPDILKHYQLRFRHVLVDEFQDTNALQYSWLKLLAGDQAKLMAVGDDDQSIYSWRGAEVAHIKKFQDDYHPVQVIRLEQNYRSTQVILQAANAVIANNTARMGKKLWTDLDEGDPITLYEAFNERDEACFILTQIKLWHAQGISYKDMAIVYRSNAQSRIFEEELVREGLPYRIYGGLRFYERAEIKDALAYLRLLVNRLDDAAFERVVNFPTRGVGQTSLQHIRVYAREHSVSLWQAAQQMLSSGGLATRTAKAIQGFLQLIDELAQAAHTTPLDDMLELVLQRSGLMQHYQKDRTDKGQSKVENLEELQTSVGRYINNLPVETEDEADFKTQQGAQQSPAELQDFVAVMADEAGSSEQISSQHLRTLSQFLREVALEAGEQQATEHSDYINLMTLHSAKGLEFPVLFMCGVEEGLFPHRMSLDEGNGLEEERRLCYVGITRAMKKLYISYAQTRMLHGTEHYHHASRFIEEIPSELLQEVRSKSKGNGRGYGAHENSARATAYRAFSAATGAQAPRRKAVASKPSKVQSVPESPYRVGQKVQHKKFGVGFIMNYEGDGEQLRLQVNFTGIGSKWLLARLAKLDIL